MLVTSLIINTQRSVDSSLYIFEMLQIFCRGNIFCYLFLSKRLCNKLALNLKHLLESQTGPTAARWDYTAVHLFSSASQTHVLTFTV